MGLYVGNNKFKLNINYLLCRLNIPVESSSASNGLMSSDNYILQDLNGLYLIAQEDGIMLMSYDNYILKDLNGLYLTSQESK